jgi:hypothetical protein
VLQKKKKKTLLPTNRLIVGRDALAQGKQPGFMNCPVGQIK